MTRRLALAALLLLAGAACRGRPPEADPAAELGRLVDSLVPHVERSTGLRFRTRPRHALRSRDEVKAFVARKLREEMPAERFRRMQRAYALLGLLPDSLDLKAVLEQLLAQQVAGFYDPDSATLYAVTGADRTTQRLTIAHELVHALQDQYLPLDSILRDKSDNDRSSAAQAILEGQANFASIRMLQGDSVAGSAAFWDAFQETGQSLLSAQGFDSVPALLREGLLFPYVAGAQFFRWWGASPFRDTLPYGPRMPASTEQILHPERYAAGDRPLPLRFTDTVPDALEDDLGEFEVRMLERQLTGRRPDPAAVPLGWGADRFRLEETPAGAALVWVLVFDEPRFRDRFLAAVGSRLGAARPGQRVALDTLAVGGRAALRLVKAPSAWPRWDRLPGVTLGPAPLK